jgi:XrtN system VIT domain protein
MQRFLAPLRDRTISIGLIALALSLLVFCIPFLVPGDQSHVPVFVICFAISLSYFVVRKVIRGRDPERATDRILLNLLLLFVSAFALNRFMEVFAASPLWLCIFLVAICANFVLTYYYHLLPRWGQRLTLAILGCAAILFTYQAIYLVPIYAISIPGLLLLGISIHAFVPVILLVYTCRKASQLAGISRGSWGAFASGIAACISVVCVYSIAWDNRVVAINRAYDRTLSEGTEDIPAWIQVAQVLRRDAISERILKSGLVYHIPRWESEIFFDIPTRSFADMQPIHDPLVVLASVFAPKVRMSREDKVNILMADYESRHHGEERLWSGTDLSTEAVHTQVRTWPSHHLAYTEQIITVANHLERARWAAPQEALYTFHLPEGGVVTSLSLWINGKEARGVLTTREKADTAYRTIVGVERHDPSVAHWQEGNRVVVRVYPVDPGGRRVFKIGVTSPLVQDGKELVYRNTWLEGPDVAPAEETVEIRNDGGDANEQGRQVAFRGAAADETYHGSLRRHWSYRLPDPGLSTEAFGFEGNHYSLQPLKYTAGFFNIRQLFLDINASWTRKEFDEIIRIAGTRPVWIEDGDLVRVTEKNASSLFQAASRRRFSLFPFYRLPREALVVTKSGDTGPDLSDLKDTRFHTRLEEFSRKGQPALVFHIGDDMSGYLKALADFRCFQYQHGTIADMEQALANGRFRLPQESENEVAIPGAGLCVVKEAGTGAATAPDHLMRLFAFNHLMRQYGQQGIDNKMVDSSLVAEAKQSHIVSPVSSIVVLETSVDYKRFGIDEKQNGLANATLKSSGAVPEPHEWLLNALVLAVAIFLFFKMRSGI